MDGQCVKKLPVRNFRWIEKYNISKFDEKFIKNYDENGDKGYILEVGIEYLKNLHTLHSDLPFLPERMKIISVLSMLVLYKIKKTMLYIYQHYNKH